MKSTTFTFKKKQPNQDQPQAPEVHSHAYFGCPDLDRVADFQFPKSSSILITEDRLSRHSVALARYFIGYGLVANDATAVYAPSVEDWKHLFPKPMEKKKLAKMSDQSQPGQNLIAWRYNHQKLGTQQSDLRSDYQVLDLSKNEDLSTKVDLAKTIIFKDVLESETLKDLYENIEADAQNLLSSPDDTTTKRFVLYGIETLLFGQPSNEIHKFFKAINLLARSSHIIFLTILAPDSVSNIQQLKGLFDMVMDIGIIHNNKLMPDFQGTLTFSRIKSIDRFLQYSLMHSTYGIKNDKSCLAVQLLYEHSLAHTDDTNEDNPLTCTGSKPNTGIDF